MLNSRGAFVGQRLELARIFRGLTQQDLATRVSVSVGLISLYENGRQTCPSDDLVAAFAEVLGVESRFFYEPIVDPWLEEQCSFRHLRSTAETLKKRARAHGTLLGMVVQYLTSKLRLPAFNVPQIAARGHDDIQTAAEQCRIHWRLPVDAAIGSQMTRVLERAGVIVTQHFFATEKIDAFSRRGQTTVVVLNTAKTSTSRWIFDMAHELGHLVLHADVRTGTKETEEEANRFASAFLLPYRGFSRAFRARPFSWEQVFELKRHWHTSAAAIVRRAYDLQLLDAVSYRRCYKYMAFKGWNRREPQEPPAQEPELLPLAFRRLEQDLGEAPAAICAGLHLQPSTFRELTGIPVPTPTPKGSIVTFARR